MWVHSVFPQLHQPCQLQRRVAVVFTSSCWGGMGRPRNIKHCFRNLMHWGNVCQVLRTPLFMPYTVLTSYTQCDKVLVACADTHCWPGASGSAPCFVWQPASWWEGISHKPCPQHAHLRCCTPCPSSMTTCPPWTMTTSGGASPPTTRCVSTLCHTAVVYSDDIR
jgi:hypothetical protein